MRGRSQRFITGQYTEGDHGLPTGAEPVLGEAAPPEASDSHRKTRGRFERVAAVATACEGQAHRGPQADRHRTGQTAVGLIPGPSGTGKGAGPTGAVDGVPALKGCDSLYRRV